MALYLVFLWSDDLQFAYNYACWFTREKQRLLLLRLLLSLRAFVGFAVQVVDAAGDDVAFCFRFER